MKLILALTIFVFSNLDGLTALSARPTSRSASQFIIERIEQDLKFSNSLHLASFYYSSAGRIEPSEIARIQSDLTMGQAVVLKDVSADDKESIMASLPIKHDSDYGDSAILLIDTFEDMHGACHYRMINLPRGQSHVHGLVHNWQASSIGGIQSAVGADRPSSTDAALLDALSDFTGHAIEVVDAISSYLHACGGLVPDIVICFNHVQSTSSQFASESNRHQFADHIKSQRVLMDTDISATSSMVPETGAVWREVVESTFRYWQIKWGSPFPFEKDQVFAHRLNSYWYIYLQAPPYQRLYYAFMLVDGLHNPNTQLDIDSAVGYYLTNLEIDLVAQKLDGQPDRDNIFWIKSSPPTQNTEHSIGRSWSSTDSYSLNVNLGFKGKEYYGDIKFNYTHTFTAAYEEKRDITDWGVVENTEPVIGRGSWNYYQTWPVDMQIHGLFDFSKVWEMYYEQSWNPCIVKDVPNLSKYALGTHNTMVWAISPNLQSPDGRNLDIKFGLEFYPTAGAHTCEIYDSHHKMSVAKIDFSDMKWQINIADLNNIERNVTASR